MRVRTNHLALVGILLLACRCRPEPSPIWTQTADGIIATLTVTPSPPQAMTASTLTLVLQDMQGEPLTGAAVALDLSMPGMEMPENQPACQEGEDGGYQAQAIFTMGGTWRIRADVTTDGGSATLAFYLTAE